MSLIDKKFPIFPELVLDNTNEAFGKLYGNILDRSAVHLENTCSVYVAISVLSSRALIMHRLFLNNYRFHPINTEIGDIVIFWWQTGEGMSLEEVNEEIRMVRYGEEDRE